jgi:Asp-tRNA(Asn)/Glu-tRNA(Gln) amidotransferase A subunit family amidase
VIETRRRFMAVFSSLGLSSTLLPGVLWARMQESGAQKVSKQMFRDATAVAGIEFSDEEHEMLVDAVNQNLARYAEFRKLPLGNSVPMAVRFNPVVPGTKFDMQRKAVRWARAANVKLPAKLDDVAFWSAMELAQLLKTKQVSSVALTEMYLKRLKQVNEKLHCVVTFTDELAMKQARQADAEIAAGKYRGPLHGIPWGCKDIIAKAGYVTTWGAAPYKEQMISEDATVVKRLEAAGAVLIAKLTTGELAGGDYWFGGQTKNPWNLEQGSSGSSAGPASATAAGAVGFSIGSETGGSIVSPSTRCGATGMRPTFGRVSRYGAMTLAWSLDKLGPICRGVEDCAAVLHAIQGPDGVDMTVMDMPFNWDAELDIRKLRVGYVKAAFDQTRQVKEEKDNDTAALEKLRALGVTLKPIELPAHLPIADTLRITYAEFSAAHDDLTRSNRDDLLARQGKDSTANLFRSSQLVPSTEYIQAQRVRTLIMESLAKAMSDIDVYVCPISSNGGGGVLGVNTALGNLTGVPAVVVRNGFSNAGIPTSMCFVGKLYGEAEMLALAKAYQDATDWHKRHPEL